MLEGLSPEWTETKNDKEDWAPYDVIGHLIYCEEADWMPRAEVILDQGDNRTFEPFDRLAQERSKENRSATSPLTEFTDLSPATPISKNSSAGS